MFTQFVKFSLVGVFNTIIHYAVFYYLFSVLGIYHLLASAVGFSIAVVNSYFFNKHWTFRNNGNVVRYQFSKFVIVNLVSLLINLGCMLLLVESFLINPLLAQLMTIGFTLIVNFSGNKFWSFKQVHSCDK